MKECPMCFGHNTEERTKDRKTYDGKGSYKQLYNHCIDCEFGWVDSDTGKITLENRENIENIEN